MEIAEKTAAIQNLLRAAELSADETDALYRRATDRSYWRALDPDSQIEGGGGSELVEAKPLSQNEFERQLNQLRTEGYFKIDALLDVALVERMRLCLEKVRAARWPLVFTYVYDEYWQIVRAPSIRRLFEAFFGTGYRQNSNVWTYYVAPVTGASGWPPHSDAVDGDASTHLTLWVPLAEATVDNGCIYVIPRSFMPATMPSNYGDLKTLTRDELRSLLQGTRALPARPGAAMGWNHQLIHWGSVARGQTEPRISIGLEFLSNNAQPRESELPMFDAVALPGFEERLMAIGKSLLEYGRFEPAINRYKALGARLWNDGKG